jgi:hypothetical protein
MVGAGRFERPTPCAQGGLPAFFGNALFSSIYISMRYGQPVEPCGILLSPEEPGSYKIIYSGLPPPDVPFVVPAEPRRGSTRPRRCRARLPVRTRWRDIL